MYHPFKKIRIAVVGPSSSGKSFLLYDLIHAFSILGYHPEELPLSYPHSSFGAFFYDNFNSRTGGMLKTDGLCRPENHYGAYLSGNLLPIDIPVDFLNIPGEVFNLSKQRIDLFFKVKELIERNVSSVFYLSTWKSPSGAIIKLIVPKDFDPSSYHNFLLSKMSYEERRIGHMLWENILYDLKDGKYEEKSRKRVSGEYIFKNITEISIDSLLLTLETKWSAIAKEPSDPQWGTLKGAQVIDYFYPLAYCDLATDIILCDKLTDDTNVVNLENWICQFFDHSKSVSQHFYLAFRAADTIILRKPAWQQDYVRMLNHQPASIQKRNDIYSRFLIHMQEAFECDDKQLDDLLDHIMKTVGDSFWNLLNLIYQKNFLQQHFSKKLSMYELRNSEQFILPPHAYFTATPIDDNFSIYKNDAADITRFYHEKNNHRKSFTREVLSDMLRHQCFGSLQLLTDILIQNDIPLFWHDVIKHRNKLLHYSQYKF